MGVVERIGEQQGGAERLAEPGRRLPPGRRANAAAGAILYHITPAGRALAAAFMPLRIRAIQGNRKVRIWE